MLQGERIGLRAVTADDAAVFETEIFSDVGLWMIASGGPWVPRPADRAQARYESEVRDDDPKTVHFAVQELANGELAGRAMLWGIDTHNRSSHLGFTLRPSFRGRGLGTDTIRTLCDYGFRVRGLHRLQVDTLSSNTPARKASEAAGFVLEGELRENGWVDGEFVNEVKLGLLRGEWQRRKGRP